MYKQYVLSVLEFLYLGKLWFTDVHISRELVDPCDGSCESAGGLVHPRPPQEGSFRWRLKAQEIHVDMFTFPDPDDALIPACTPLLRDQNKTSDTEQQVLRVSPEGASTG